MTKTLIDLKRITPTPPTTDVMDDSNINVYMLNNLQLNDLLGASFEQNMDRNPLLDLDNTEKTLTDLEGSTKTLADLDSNSKTVTDKIGVAKTVTDLESP